MHRVAFGGGIKPVSIENIFGFAFGGPVVHDKLFVFGTGQWDRFRSTANGSTLTITNAGRHLDIAVPSANALH